MVIRLATADDDNAIIALWNAAAGEPGSCMRSAKPLTAFKLDHHRRTGAAFYLAEDQGQIVGLHAHRCIQSTCFYVAAVGSPTILNHLALAAARDALAAGCTTNEGIMPDDPTIRERTQRDALGCYTYTPTGDGRLKVTCETQALIDSLEALLNP